MRTEIEVLDDVTINKIAAGEVVEAPFSVVKELIENSIDAKASVITLEIKDGGKKHIRITDNGTGIKEEYVEKAFLRHSTSKINNINDLTHIASLGFRGEALASIAAVSQLEIITRTKDREHGVQLELEGGRIKLSKKVGCPIGTTVIIKNLFFNTPARLKFMKTNQAETIKISEIVMRLALSNPSISFQYVNNNNIMFTTPGDSQLSKVILSVFDKETYKNLIPLNSNSIDLTLDGFIGQPNFVRGNRNLQILFVNGRYVKSKIISKAIAEAYKEKIVINKYPICILNLSLDPSIIDINVHPAKTEVKFEEDEKIYEFIFNAIRTALAFGVTIPKLEIRKPTENKYMAIDNNTTTSIADNYNKTDIKTDYLNKNIEVNEERESYYQIPEISIVELINDENEKLQLEFGIGKDIKEEEIIQSSFLTNLLDQYKIIGQIFNTYIVLEKEDGIFLIDQHAAHERLLFNKFTNEIQTSTIASQRLLEPQVLELSNEDYLSLFANISIFNKLGFSIDDFGINTVIIREVPLVLGRPRNFSFMYEILDEIRNNNIVEDFFEEVIIKRSCKEAVKAKDRLDLYEIKKLVEELYTLTPPLTCPHGRPIILTMSKYEIEKHFKRIQ